MAHVPEWQPFPSTACDVCAMTEELEEANRRLCKVRPHLLLLYVSFRNGSVWLALSTSHPSAVACVEMGIIIKTNLEAV